MVFVAVEGGIVEILAEAVLRLMADILGVAEGPGVELREDSLTGIREALGVEGATEAERDAEL